MLGEGPKGELCLWVMLLWNGAGRETWKDISEVEVLGGTAVTLSGRGQQREQSCFERQLESEGAGRWQQGGESPGAGGQAGAEMPKWGDVEIHTTY